MDFKGPVRGPRPYVLIVVDEYSCFPFVFPCKNMTSSTVTDCLSLLFCFLGFPGCIHSDRGAPFVSRETRSFLTERGIAFSTSTPYHPEGNSQCERVNQTMWWTISFCCTVNAFPKKGGNLFCWKLCMRSVLLCASRRMKLRMNGCFVSLARPCSVPHFLHGCSRRALCFLDVL